MVSHHSAKYGGERHETKLASSSRNNVDKKEMKKRTASANLFCVTRKRNKQINSFYWDEKTFDKIQTYLLLVCLNYSGN